MTSPFPQDSSVLPDEFDFAADVDPVDEQAATWLVRLTSGHATAEERAAFVRWRDADARHAEALSRLRAVWGVLPAGLEDVATVSTKPVVQASAVSIVPRRRRRIRDWALAASLLAGVTVAHQAQREWRHDLVTTSGERRTVALEDGSTVLLGGDTALDVDMTGAQRRLRLARGEAYFDVRSDRERPFVIDAGGAQVEVVGTRFSVRRDGDTGEVTVAEGRVRVHAQADGADLLLEANQRAAFAGGQLDAPQSTNADEALAWRGGKLVIDGLSLDAVVELLNRHRAGLIVVRGNIAQGRRINAVIDLDRTDEWLAALEAQQIGRVARLGPVTLIY